MSLGLALDQEEQRQRPHEVDDQGARVGRLVFLRSRFCLEKQFLLYARFLALDLI